MVSSVILAGGEGTRLFPLTAQRCKPAVCFAGRYRLIDIPLSLSLQSGIKDIFVITQHLHEGLHEHVRTAYPKKVDLLYPGREASKKVKYLGTADAVRKNLKHLLDPSVEHFLILSGDQLYHMDYRKLIDFANKTGADLVISSLPIEEKDAKRMGLLKKDAAGRITDFVEKPQAKRVLDQFKQEDGKYLASMGIYVFKRSALLELLQEKGNDFGKDLIPLQMRKGNTFSYVHEGYWEDIGTISSYYAANLQLIAPQTWFQPHLLPEGNLASAEIHGTEVIEALINPGIVSRAKEISHSIIGVGSKIGEGTVIRDAIVQGAHIGENCHLEKCILDEGSALGNRVVLTNKKGIQEFDGEGIYIREGIIVVPSGSKLPDDFTL